jgi:16S rRNA (cytidine1402-2'-O)-methyltransferase
LSGLGKLLVIATPIGNLEDLTLRAKRILSEVDALACEDTRHTRILLARYDIPRPKLLFSYHEHNEDRAAQRILGLLASGQNVGLCSNAGYPGISDPGYVVISQAVSRGFAVEVIPGASAVPTALLSSGLPTSSFTFKGFPPRKAGRRRTFLEAERDLPHTLVFYESPNRLGALLQAALEVLGDRQAAVCIELTKMFEDVRRGPLSTLAREFEDAKVKGEVAVVIAGNNPKFAQDPDGSDDNGLSDGRVEP